MRLVIIESPFAGSPQEIYRNTLYARAAVRDSLMRGEAPIASHLLYTQEGILDDAIPEERKHGIDAGLAWRKVTEASVVYCDFGISKGMGYGIALAVEQKNPVEMRYLPKATLDKIAKVVRLCFGNSYNRTLSEVACVNCGIPFKKEPSVTKRHDDKLRCNDCNLEDLEFIVREAIWKI